MTIARLGELLGSCDPGERWLMISEFLNEYIHERPIERLRLLEEEPASVGDERWDAFLAALAEHLALKDERRGPPWYEQRILRQFWFPFNTPDARAEAIVHAPVAFRRRGVFIARRELEIA